MTKPTFEPDRSKELADELAKRVHHTGFNALSKNDFYGFVLYLLDRYSNVHSLSIYYSNFPYRIKITAANPIYG